MMNANWARTSPAEGTLRRRWHMIDEIDLTGLLIRQTAWLRLCDTLEALADGLPNWPVAEMDVIEQSLAHFAERSDFEEQDMFDRLLSAGGVTAQSRRLVELLDRRRAKRLSIVQELRATILSEREGIAPEAFGYQLRSFFEEVRETIMVERMAVLMLAGSRLTRDARATIVESLV